VNTETENLCFVQAFVPGLKLNQAQKDTLMHRQMKQYIAF